MIPKLTEDWVAEVALGTHERPIEFASKVAETPSRNGSRWHATKIPFSIV
jgi:hypothetical protein